MGQYLVIFLVVFGINVIPAFAPPTWTVLVYFSLANHVPALAIIAIGVIAAALGRLILATYFRRYRNRLPSTYTQNMHNASTHLTRSKGHTVALLTLFLLSPLSSAQLFEAAGIMPKLALRPLVLAFAAGRLVSYSTYVLGAKSLATTSLGDVIIRNITSPTAIALQVLMIVGLVLLGTIKWKPYQENF